MAIGKASRERVRKAVERAFNGVRPEKKRETIAADESVIKGPSQVESEIRDMVQAIVRGVGAGVADLDADTKQVELVFGLKLKAGLSDVFAMLADLDRQTNVRVKVTLQHPQGVSLSTIAANDVALTAESQPDAASNGNGSGSGKGSSAEPSSYVSPAVASEN